MKFAKYLESQSIPEWRKAYINYKALKKRLKAIEKVKLKQINLLYSCYLQNEKISIVDNTKITKIEDLILPLVPHILQNLNFNLPLENMQPQ
jgi:SPX domain protein involved in polyphosphate accumulation